MTPSIRHILLAVLLLNLNVSTYAQSDSYQQNRFVQAEGSVEVPRGFLSSGLDQEVRDKALSQAKRVALSTALSRISGPKADVVNSVRKIFDERLDSIISEVTVLSERHDEAERRYVVRIRATVQWGQVDSLLRTSSASAGIVQPQMTAATGSRVVFLALAREASEVKRFDVKRVDKDRATTKNTTSTFAENKSAEQTVNPTRSTTVEGAASNAAVTAQATRETIRERGGSATSKRDAIEYVPVNTSDLSTRLNFVLTQNTIRSTPYAMAAGPCKLPSSAKFQELFSQDGEDGLQEVIGEIVSRLQQCPAAQVRYFVIAAVDVDGLGDNPDGRKLAQTKVRVNFYDVSDVLAGVLASADGQAQDTGADQTDVIRKVLSRSADVAGDNIINILRTQQNR